MEKQEILISKKIAYKGRKILESKIPDLLKQIERQNFNYAFISPVTDGYNLLSHISPDDFPILWIIFLENYIITGPFMRSIRQGCPICLILSLTSNIKEIQNIKFTKNFKKFNFPQKINFPSNTIAIDLETQKLIYLPFANKHPECNHFKPLSVPYKTENNNLSKYSFNYLSSRLKNKYQGPIRCIKKDPCCFKENFSNIQLYRASVDFPYFDEIGRKKLFSCFGIDQDQLVSKTKALFEAIERYCVLSRPQQYPISKLQTRFDFYKEKINASTNSYWGFDYKNNPVMLQGKDIFMYNSTCLSSSGCAAHYSLESAKKNALLELIERDNALSHWKSGKCAPHISIDSLNSFEKNIIAALSKKGFTTAIIDCSIFKGIYSFETVIYNTDGIFPSALISSASDLDANNAIRKSLLEAIGIFSTLRNLNNFGKKISPTKILTSQDHTLFFAQPTSLQYIEHYIHPSEKRNLKDYHSPKSTCSLNYLYKKLPLVICDSIAYYDLTISSLKDLGIIALRCICPRLDSLIFGKPYLDSSTLIEVEKLRNIPHPFS